jgi:hypothetical protein
MDELGQGGIQMMRIVISTSALLLLFMHVMPAAGETTTAKTTEGQWGRWPINAIATP